MSDSQPNGDPVAAHGRLNAAILEAALDAIITMDHEGRVVDFNPAAEKMFGYNQADAIGRKLADLVIPSRLREKHRKGLARYLESGKAAVLGRRAEMIAMRSDGAEFPVEISIVRIPTDGPPMFTGYIRDLTARNAWEQAMKATEVQLRTMIRQAPAALAMFDSDMRYLAASRRWMTDYGLGDREIIGLSHYEVFPEIPDRWKRIHQRVLAGEAMREPEDKFERADGTVQWLMWEVMPWRHPDNTIGGLVMLTEDITARKSAEEQLRWQAQLLDEVRESIVATDLDGKITYWGRGAEKLYGYTAEEVMHKPYRSFAGSIDTVGDESLKRQLRVDGSWRGENIQRRRDGSLFWSSVIISVITDKAGIPCGYIGIDHDISDLKRREDERREMERRLEQTQRLESLGVLAGGIAHDFNNILTAILGHAELALGDLSPVAPARGSLAEIKKAAIRASELCSQLLAYSGKRLLQTQDVALNALIEEMLHMLKTCVSKKCLLNLHLARNLPPVHGDPSQVQQVIMNLIINASDAIGDETGVIAITTGTMDVTDTYLTSGYTIEPVAPGRYVFLEVSDTGSGMDQDTMQRIFEPFFTTKFAGRGLGLSAVLGIMRAHHGAVRVYSEIGQGTTFKILFPAVTDAAADAGPPIAAADTAWRGKGTVLVADDEEQVRSVTCALLRHLGFDSITADDGRQAVDIFRSKRAEIDLVLLDLTMPNMNGAEAFSEIRQIDPGARVVIVSGYSEIDITTRFAGKGIDGFLQKPFTLAKMREIVSTVHRA